MELATGLLGCAVMVFMSILLVLQNISFHLANTLVGGSLQMHVIPIFKNDNRQLKINCSPVSLLTCFSKICEEVFLFHLYNFLMAINQLFFCT